MFENSTKFTTQPIVKKGIMGLPKKEAEKELDRVLTQDTINQINEMEAKRRMLAAQKTEKQQEIEELRREKLMEEAKKHKKLETQREKEARIIREKADILSKNILKCMKGKTDEEIRFASTQLLLNEENFEALVSVYAKSPIASETHLENSQVTRKALSTIIDEASARIEASHCEFSQVKPAKTIRK